MLTLTSALTRTVRFYGDRTAVLDHSGHFTWTEFAQRVARAGGALQSLGVGRGERYGIIARNSLRQAELTWTLSRTYQGSVLRSRPPVIPQNLDSHG